MPLDPETVLKMFLYGKTSAPQGDDKIDNGLIRTITGT